MGRTTLFLNKASKSWSLTGARLDVVDRVLVIA